MKEDPFHNKFLPSLSLPLAKMPSEKTVTYSITPKTDKIPQLINELNENIDADELENLQPASSASGELEITRSFTDHLKDHLVVRGAINANFFTRCVRCLEIMPSSISVDFLSCFISSDLEESELFKDQITLFHKQENLDLYFYYKHKIDLTNVMHEQIFLNMDPCPIHSDDCKGLCQTCGINLNFETCKHNFPVS